MDCTLVADVGVGSVISKSRVAYTWLSWNLKYCISFPLGNGSLQTEQKRDMPWV